MQNTLKALQALARYLRSRMALPVIGVTGTNGKTTTKELVSSIFGQHHKVLKTTGKPEQSYRDAIMHRQNGRR